MLHWFFSINPSCPELSPLSNTFYTHYCPLFHITNLIALFSPIILTFKLSKKAAYWTAWAMAGGLDFMFARLSLLWKASGLEAYFKEAAVKEKVKVGIKQTRYNKTKAEKRLRQILTTLDKDDFQSCWRFVNYLVDQRTKGDEVLAALTISEAERIWNEDQIEKQRQREDAIQMMLVNAERDKRLAEIRKKQQEQLVYWVGVSRMLIKGMLNTFYVCAAGGLCYGTYKISGPTWSLMCDVGLMSKQLAQGLYEKIWEIDYVSFFCTAGKALGCSAGGVVGICVLVKGLSYVPFGAIARRLDFLSPAFHFVKSGICATFDCIEAGVKNTTHFVKMFYEENCPAITIVKDQSCSKQS